MTRIKICGVTNLPDALACVEAGADFLGFNFYKRSPRYIEPFEAARIVKRLPSTVASVGVFVNEESPSRVEEIASRAGVELVQLHGDESPEYCRALADRFVIKALRVSADFAPERVTRYETRAFLLDAFRRDAYGGTGESFDWSKALAVRETVEKLFLAGGLSVSNVGDAVERVRPYAVDACSLLESAPGRKDAESVRAFIEAVRKADDLYLRMNGEAVSR